MGKHGKQVQCAMCQGKGYIKESKNGHVVKRSCGRCNGSGTV
jgi:DnaJ-class molecular chaperone